MDPERARQYPFLPSLGAGLTVARTEGCFLVLPDGRRILDAAGGAVVASIGHGRQEVAEVAARALAETSYVVPPFVTEHRVRLVERLRASWLPRRHHALHVRERRLRGDRPRDPRSRASTSSRRASPRAGR